MEHCLIDSDTDSDAEDLLPPDDRYVILTATDADSAYEEVPPSSPVISNLSHGKYRNLGARMIL